MRKIRSPLWIATVFVFVALLLLSHQKDEQRSQIATNGEEPVPSQSFRRISPTTPSAHSVSTLIGELSAPSPLVRERAATDLGVLGLAALDASPDLKRLADDDPDEEVRKASRLALFNVRGAQQPPSDF